MKKLIILTAFLGLGSLAVMAQNTVPAKPAKSNSTADVKQTTAQPTAATEVVDVVAPATPENKSTDKKTSCAPTDKKSCGTEKNSTKKSCCSKK